MPDAPLTTLPPEAATIAAAIFGAIILGSLAVLLWGMAQWAKKPPHRVGEFFGGERVEVVEWSGHEGMVRVGGELWRAQSQGEIAPGDKVRITRADGLVLEVSKS